MKTVISGMAIIVFLVGCAGYRPVVDLKDADRNKYEVDLKECQAYAEEVSPGQSTFLGMGIGAGIGAVLGAIICAPLGGNASAQCAGIGAGVGGVSGGAQGAAAGAGGQVQIIKNCMLGRGYKVLQ